MKGTTLYLGFFFTILLNEVISFTCTQNFIEVLGTSSSLIMPLFQALIPAYTEYRNRFNVNATIKIYKSVIGVPAYNKLGLVGPVLPLAPVVFVSTYSALKLHDNEIMFPIFAQPIVIIYNLPKVTNLNLSVTAVGDIYDGKISYWDDKRITEYNPNAVFPHKPIIPVARMDSSQVTSLFTSVLVVQNPDWHQHGIISSPNFINDTCCNSGGACCVSTSWSPNVTLKFGNQVVGLVGYVNSLTYSVGYATLGTVTDFQVSISNLVNNQSKVFIVSPTTENVQKVMYNFMNSSDTNDLEIDLENILIEDSYPLTTFSYMILNISYDNVLDCCIIRELIGFVDFLFKADDSLFRSNGFEPLIQEIKQRIQQVVFPKIKCREGFVYPAYLATFEKSSSLEVWQITLIAIVVLVTIALAALITYTYYKKYHIDETRWLVDPKRVILQRQDSKQQQGTNADAISEQSSVEQGSICNSISGHHLHHPAEKLKEFMVRGVFDGNKVHLDSLQCKHPRQWSKQSKQMMNKLKTMLHQNLSTLFGITVIDNVPRAIFESYSKGTLHYVLQTTRYHVTNEMMFQFTINVAEGLKYLHRNKLAHGFISSITCYVDSTWVVQIFHWEMFSIYQKENFQIIKTHNSYQTNSIFDEKRLIELLYTFPTLSVHDQQQSDVYSYGVLMIEIFTKNLPYTKETEEGILSYPDIIDKKFNHNIYVRPNLDKIPKDMAALALACINQNSSEGKPNMAQVCSKLNKSSLKSKGIVDLILDELETHAEALEKKVEERTLDLKNVTERMRSLLNEVLPVQIADQLLNGFSVLPEQFECISVYFSDIVGFTTISAKSTPIEVMTLLNDLWLTFDSTIEKFDVYKVDTIGDAYMVCSGLPVRNGMEHCREIAQLSLTLLHECSQFKIKHLPDEKLKIRIGINSGPATAGVVGSKMPQYCVFGDTINTAARMESSSLPEKIQTSERFYQLLNEYFPNTFQMSFRGEIEVKGKGNMKTYWLLPENECQSDNTM